MRQVLEWHHFCPIRQNSLTGVVCGYQLRQLESEGKEAGVSRERGVKGQRARAQSSGEGVKKGQSVHDQEVDRKREEWGSGGGWNAERGLKN